ncbi:MAG TPA: M48 family metalloprotease, partial [Miltoncostaeaceae bacterium]|nr:M48 family metalloprotease [Miltoncostaeaceae bacterium]
RHDGVSSSVPPVAFTDDPGRALDGGWAGGTLLLTPSCRPLVGRPELTCLVARELGHRRRRDRGRGILFAAAWYALAPPLAAALLAPDPGSPAQVVAALAATATVWSWLGLLALPSLGRRQAYAADRFWLEAGGDPGVLRDALELLASRNLTERSRPVWVERVFHPVPSLENRLAAIDAWRGR